MQAHALTGGFENAPVASAHGFRAALDALARPGTIVKISGAQPPAPLSVAAGTLLLVLCDPQTPIWLAAPLRLDVVIDWIRFHTAAPITQSRGDAVFAIGSWGDLMPITDFPIGTPQYPDRSTTLIIECETLQTNGATLRGPGIKNTTSLTVPDVVTLQNNASLFPLGLDFFFTAGSQIAAIPRTTKLED